MKANFETGLKICSRCKRELPLSCFNKTRSNSDGFESMCKSCKKEITKRYLSTDSRKESDRRYYQRHKQELFDKRVSKKDSRKEYDKLYYQNNKEKIKDRVYRYVISEQGRKTKNEYVKRKKKEDLNYRIRMFYRWRIASLLKSKKTQSTLKYLGCTIEELKKHLESQFEPGMSWENYGRKGWHIDHIIPCSYFDLSIEENQYICFNFRNLQPLWAKENLLKSDKVPDNIEELVEFLKREIYDHN